MSAAGSSWFEWSAAALASGDDTLLRTLAELRALRLEPDPLKLSRRTADTVSTTPRRTR